MKTSDIFGKNLIIPALKSSDKSGIIEELADYLVGEGVIKDKKALVNALQEREKLGSTGIGDNIAIPHAKSAEVDTVIALFARSKKGISFDSLDGKPVNYIFLLIAPTQSGGDHLKAMAKISKMLKGEEFRRKLLTASDSQELYQAIVDENEKII
ncbi:MAG: PTS sugar transporter subunit IIA [Nitrospinota bacterium]|nr:PTS sugar transporter subunit IIA [Nitrospinota bacterium]